MSARISYCHICKTNVGRLDFHIKSKHPTLAFSDYFKKYYLTKDYTRDFTDKETGKNTCQICKVNVGWLETHVQTKHSITLREYTDTYLISYEDVLESLKGNVAKHHILRPWDSYMIYKKKVDRMVRSISYKKQLDMQTAEDLSSQSIELFLRFHDEYDPNFVSPDPKYAQKTDDYYEKYMFSKIRAQLGYFVQKHYIHSNREWAGLGLATELEPYSPVQEDVLVIEEEDIWEKVRCKLTVKQVMVFDLILSGLPQREISEKVNLTQSWVSSIKSHIKDVIKTLMEHDQDFAEKLEEYYFEHL